MSEEASLTLGGLRAVTVGDRAAARAIVVILHGFGMTPTDLSPFARSIQLPAWFLFPEGPRDASIGGRAWWHIDAKLREEALARGPRDFAEQYPPDLEASSERLAALLDEVRVLAEGRPIVACGFSQGGMLTCHTLLRHRSMVAGAALLSASRVAFAEWRAPLAAGFLRDLPMLVSHGQADADLAFAAGVSLKDCLVEAGATVTWLPFEQGHEIPLVVWRALRKFVRARVA
jgi:phospholipase/carboxylesterase